MKRLKQVAFPICTVIALVVCTLAVAQSSNNDGPAFINEGDAVFSRARIVEINDRIVRLDTATGELSRFRGEASGKHARGTFDAITNPVNGNTSGFLEVQQAGDATFLVDVVSGRTWILRVRSSNNAAWIDVDLPN